MPFGFIPSFTYMRNWSLPKLRLTRNNQKTPQDRLYAGPPSDQNFRFFGTGGIEIWQCFFPALDKSWTTSHFRTGFRLCFIVRHNQRKPAFSRFIAIAENESHAFSKKSVIELVIQSTLVLPTSSSWTSRVRFLRTLLRTGG